MLFNPSLMTTREGAHEAKARGVPPVESERGAKRTNPGRDRPAAGGQLFAREMAGHEILLSFAEQAKAASEKNCFASLFSPLSRPGAKPGNIKAPVIPCVTSSGTIAKNWIDF